MIERGLVSKLRTESTRELKIVQKIYSYSQILFVVCWKFGQCCGPAVVPPENRIFIKSKDKDIVIFHTLSAELSNIVQTVLRYQSL